MDTLSQAHSLVSAASATTTKREVHLQARLALGPRRPRHDHDRQAGQDDTDEGGVGLLPAAQVADALDGGVDSEREERERDELQRPALLDLVRLTALDLVSCTGRSVHRPGPDGPGRSLRPERG
ncbi:hypothetical protein [Streptomyces hirsutus]|uniref:hypothetical protein n=1 Tax=Streptomyces hirsutus TaxID=35620 RepID=UPI0036C88629